MRRSTDRILTTHVGALERPPELAKALAEQGQWTPAALGQLRAGVADVVKRQLETGLDVIDDGEYGKTMWSQYVRDRLDNRPRALATDQVAKGRDRELFPGFYAWADASKTLFGLHGRPLLAELHRHAPGGHRPRPLPARGRQPHIWRRPWVALGDGIERRSPNSGRRAG